MHTLTTVAKFVASLGEAVASGPYFKVMLVNLLPGQILQPFIDSAFKKRGIDPEKFWGDAGLPAWRFPDPNGQRFPNGAPAPGPRRSRAPRSIPDPRCSRVAVLVHAASRRPAAPGNPMPCADLTTGPFGGTQELRPARRGHLSPEPERSRLHARRARRGHPWADAARHAGRTGAVPPAPPGARTVPLGPLPGPPDFTPGIAPLPPR